MSAIVDKFGNSKDVEFLQSIKSDLIDLSQTGFNDILKELDRNFKVIIKSVDFITLQTEEDEQEIEVQLSQKNTNIFSSVEIIKSDVLGSVESLDFNINLQINLKDGLQLRVLGSSGTDVKGILVVNYVRVPDDEIEEEEIED